MKKFVIATACVVSLGLIAIGVQQFSASADETTMTLEEAKQQASEQYPGKVTEAELETENGKQVYEIEITGEAYTYDLKLDAHSGKVLKLEEKEKIAKSKSKSSEVNEDRSTDSKSSDKQKIENDNQKNSVPVTMKEAQDIALAETGGTIIEADLDEDDGSTYYEFEIQTDRGEAEVEVNAFTGEIIQISYDDE